MTTYRTVESEGRFEVRDGTIVVTSHESREGARATCKLLNGGSAFNGHMPMFFMNGGPLRLS